MLVNYLDWCIEQFLSGLKGADEETHPEPKCVSIVRVLTSLFFMNPKKTRPLPVCVVSLLYQRRKEKKLFPRQKRSIDGVRARMSDFSVHLTCRHTHTQTDKRRENDGEKTLKPNNTRTVFGQVRAIR